MRRLFAMWYIVLGERTANIPSSAADMIVESRTGSTLSAKSSQTEIHRNA